MRTSDDIRRTTAVDELRHGWGCWGGSTQGANLKTDW